jgi:hypothetical protein
MSRLNPNSTPSTAGYRSGVSAPHHFARTPRPGASRTGARRRARSLLGSALLSLGVVAMPVDAHAQQSGWVTQTWASASSSRNGFIHGTMIIDYAFQICGGGTVKLFYSVRPGSARGYEGYWFDGVNYGVKSHWTPGNAPAMDAPWQVSFSAGTVKEWRQTNPWAGNKIDCFSGRQEKVIGQIDDFIGKGKSREEQREALKRFTFWVSATSEPMRSRTVESEIQRELSAVRSKARQDSLAQVAKARRDSLGRLAKARQDSLGRLAKARADSTAQARQERQARASGDAGTGGAVAAQGRLRPGSSTRIENTGTTQSDASRPGTASRGAPLTRAEQEQLAREQAVRQQENARQQQVERRMAQEAARERQAEAERQRRAEAAAQVTRMLEESRRREEERARQVDEAAEAVAGTVGQIMQARAEVSRHNEAIRERAANVKREHLASALAFFTAAGPRPLCTSSDTRSALEVGTVVNESLTGSECRLSNNTSAALYTLTIAKKRKVELEIVQTGFFYPSLSLRGPQTNLQDARRLEATLEPGTYLVTVTTEGPGERGTFTLATRRGQLSRTAGLSLAFVASTAGLDITNTSTPDSDSQVEFRAGVGLGDYVTLLAQYVMPQSYVYGLTAVEFGARGYLRRRHHAVRPWVQYLYGTRSISVERPSIDEEYTGNGGAYGAGVEWFLLPQIGVDASLLRATGTVMRDGAGSELSMSQTRLALGFVWHH